MRRLGVLIFLFVLSCSGGLPKEFPAPEFSFKDLLSDKEIKLSDYKGSPLMLYFFASW